MTRGGAVISARVENGWSWLGAMQAGSKIAVIVRPDLFEDKSVASQSHFAIFICDRKMSSQLDSSSPFRASNWGIPCLSATRPLRARSPAPTLATAITSDRRLFCVKSELTTKAETIRYIRGCRNGQASRGVDRPVGPPAPCCAGSRSVAPLCPCDTR